MEWGSIWQTVFAIIGSIGSAGLIIAGIVKWSADRIAEQIIIKKEFEFSQRLETLKSSLEKKNYISKVRFDLEITTYQELSVHIQKVVFSCIELFPPRIKDTPESAEEYIRYESELLLYAEQMHTSGKEAVLQRALFIPSEKYALFMVLLDECARQLALKALTLSPMTSLEGVKEFETRGYTLSSELRQRMHRLLEILREHIASLDVVDK